MRRKKRFSVRESRSQCKSAAVSADSFAATRCAAPLKRAATDWYYHIGKGTRLLISLSFCRRGKEKKKRESGKSGRPFFLFLFKRLSSYFDSPFRSSFRCDSPSPFLRSPIHYPSRFFFTRFSHPFFHLGLIRFSSTKISILFGRGIDTSSSSSRFSPQTARNPLSSHNIYFSISFVLLVFAHWAV